MDMIVRNPTEGVYVATDDYVHAVEVRNQSRLLYLSGTMGLDAAGQPAGDLDAQLDAVWRNIRVILASAEMTVDNVVRVTSYLRDAGYAERNAAARRVALGDRAVATTAIVVATLDADWLVELEIVAAA